MILSNSTFTEHFSFFKNKILNKENFAFARYADGEKIILENNIISFNTQAYVVDKWTYNNNKIFSKDLMQTCYHKEDNYYYAISCKCCDENGSNYYKKLLENHNITYSNLFINANYNKFIEFINKLDRDVVVLANKNCLQSNYPFNVIQKIPIENDCVNWYESNKTTIIKGMSLLANKYKNTLFFISAGPLSEILIHNLFIVNPDNTYIDIGSALDIYTHNKITRPYQNKNSEYSTKECVL
jgi:hypothetical protein